MAGCQPHWRLFTVEGAPICQNATMLKRYARIFWNIAYNMDSDDVFQATNCLRPCTFLEYKVSVGGGQGDYNGRGQQIASPMLTAIMSGGVGISDRGLSTQLINSLEQANHSFS